MSAEIKDATGVEATLIKGGGGIFDVVVDGTTVFSRKESGRFPDVGEIAQLI